VLNGLVSGMILFLTAAGLSLIFGLMNVVNVAHGSFFMLGAMAGGGVQSWLVTVLHTYKGIEVEVAATALTAYMLGSTSGVLVGGWFADTLKHHILPFVTGLTILSALLMVGIGIPLSFLTLPLWWQFLKIIGA